MIQRRRVRHRSLVKYKRHVVMDRVDNGLYEIVVADDVAPLAHKMVYADSKRDAIKQFQSYIDFNFPKDTR